MATDRPHAGPDHDRVVAVLLAAGAGSRFEGTGHKLLATLPGVPVNEPSTVFGQSLQHVVEAGFDTVVVVTGALDVSELAGDAATRGLLADPTVTVWTNPRWAEGQATSIQVALDAARGAAASAVVVGLADQPSITPSAWRTVAAGSAPITIATYDGRRGNPVRLAEAVWPLLPTVGDEGARVLARARPDLVSEVPCTGSANDIDTVEDLRRWQSN
ncbi:MAG: NTP transferase domain-containing protein [Ilumatobacter sp.]|nr:NTP transferase domain-containing protein [Ilumatobacter sp.]